jgi:hypothetical protein
MSVNTPNKALRIMGCDTGPAATTARTAASTLPNEEDAFDGNIVEAQLAHDTEKKSAGGAAAGVEPHKNGRDHHDLDANGGIGQSGLPADGRYRREIENAYELL